MNIVSSHRTHPKDSSMQIARTLMGEQKLSWHAQALRVHGRFRRLAQRG